MTQPNDDPSRTEMAETGLWARMARFGRVVWLVPVAWILLGLLVGFGRLGAPEAVIAGFVLLAVAIFLPRPGSVSGEMMQVREEVEAGEQPVVNAVVDALLAPSLVLDRKAVVLHRNPAADREIPQASVGQPLTYAFRQPAMADALGHVRRDGTPRHLELQLTGPNPVWYAVSLVPFTLPDSLESDAGRILVTFDNLTEQRRTEAMRVDFVANASHELRTPLTSVLGFIDTLQGPAANDAAAREKFLGIMRQQAERMKNLIEDLMSLSRIELRQHVRPTGSADLAPLLREVIEGLQNQINQSGVELDVSLDSGDTRVSGEREELYEVFENLIDNAVKYGAEGGRVTVSLESVENRRGYAFAVRVEDFGEGVDEAHVPRLTERFYRVDAESSRKKKGTGLGLAIVKHIVTRHRGQLTIRSRRGEGTRVEVLLPR